MPWLTTHWTKLPTAVLLPVTPALAWLQSGPPVGYGVMLAVILACWLCGFLWVAVDRDKRAWHDIVSRTRVVLEAKS